MTHTKANKSKVLAIILGLTMCLALMLGIVFASPTFAAHAEGGTDEILEIKGDTDVTSTDGKYRYTVSDKTLILKDYNGKQIRLNDDATINLQGNNVINIDENSHFYTAIPNRYWEATGIKADKSLTITGSGTLTINIDITNKENDENAGSMLSSHGIYSNGDLTIKGSVGITITHKELGEDYGYAIAAKNNLNIIDSASIDINTVSTALYANDGNIKLSGTGEKKIKIDRERVQWDTANAVYTSQGSVDISGTGKVILEKVNGFTVYAIYARWKPINLHDNANVEINGFNRAMLSPKGIDINKSTVKIVSTGDTSSAFSASDKTIQIQNSAVYVDVGGEFIYNYNGSGLPELQILGKSTVYVNCSNPAMCGDEGKTIRKYFALSEGGSISLINRSYPTVWAELGDGTNLEVGTKLGPSATNPTWFEYKSSDTYNGYGLTRFVYGDTSKASATINDVTIKGIQDETMSDTDVKITLTGDTFKAIAKDTDVTAWFKNMPKGLTAKVKEAVADNSTEMIITVNGIPENVLVESVWLEIPATAFTATNYGMTAEFNRNAKYEIVTSKLVDVPTPVSGLVYNGEWQEGVPATEAYTVANGGEESAGTYTAKLYLKPGYKWSDGTTEMKTVEWSIAPKPIEIDVVLEKTEYVYTGYEITPIYRVGVGTEGISNLSSSEYSVELKNNKEIGENTASITISNKTGGDYEIKNPVTKYFSIIKPVRNAPEGLKGVAPTTEGGSDGKITGTTADMEYSTDTAFTSPTPCTDTETTGLAEGMYYVRYKATTTLEPSHYATVKVMDNTVTVTDGAGEKVKKCKSGETVTIKVTVPTGKEFVKWSCTGISLPAAELEKEEITFTMPDNDVTLTATFEDGIYNIAVTNGTSSAPTAKYQEEITVTANAPATGKEFDKWVVTGITLSNEDLAKSTVTFEMPASNVTMEATYKDVIYNITVTDGTSSAPTAKYGESVTVKAEDKEGKVFKGWKDESGEIVSTQKEYTFKVEGEKTLTAVYEDKSSGGGEITPPAKKDGLSGGQIAGIVIGSVLLAGIGGFAIFWFAVKKKTFADLGVALKKGFTAMGNFFKNLGAKIKALFTKKK